MTRSKPPRAVAGGGTCMLQDAEEGVVAVADEDQRLVSGTRTGLSVVEALLSSPHKDFEIEPEKITDYIITRPVKF